VPAAADAAAHRVMDSAAVAATEPARSSLAQLHDYAFGGASSGVTAMQGLKRVFADHAHPSTLTMHVTSLVPALSAVLHADAARVQVGVMAWTARRAVEGHRDLAVTGITFPDFVDAYLSLSTLAGQPWQMVTDSAVDSATTMDAFPPRPAVTVPSAADTPRPAGEAAAGGSRPPPRPSLTPGRPPVVATPLPSGMHDAPPPVPPSQSASILRRGSVSSVGSVGEAASFPVSVPPSAGLRTSSSTLHSPALVDALRGGDPRYSAAVKTQLWLRDQAARYSGRIAATSPAYHAPATATTATTQRPPIPAPPSAATPVPPSHLTTAAALSAGASRKLSFSDPAGRPASATGLPQQPAVAAVDSPTPPHTPRAPSVPQLPPPMPPPPSRDPTAAAGTIVPVPDLSAAAPVPPVPGGAHPAVFTNMVPFIESIGNVSASTRQALHPQQVLRLYHVFTDACIDTTTAAGNSSLAAQDGTVSAFLHPTTVVNALNRGRLHLEPALRAMKRLGYEGVLVAEALNAHFTAHGVTTLLTSTGLEGGPSDTGYRGYRSHLRHIPFASFVDAVVSIAAAGSPAYVESCRAAASAVSTAIAQQQVAALAAQHAAQMATLHASLGAAAGGLHSPVVTESVRTPTVPIVDGDGSATFVLPWRGAPGMASPHVLHAITAGGAPAAPIRAYTQPVALPVRDGGLLRILLHMVSCIACCR